jgi:hypothetical protein
MNSNVIWGFVNNNKNIPSLRHLTTPKHTRISILKLPPFRNKTKPPNLLLPIIQSQPRASQTGGAVPFPDNNESGIETFRPSLDG